MATVWNQYWDELPEGYLFFPAEGEEAVRRLKDAIGLQPTMTVLDYGCGYGHAAAPLARHVGKLFLWDYSEPMRRFAQQHLAPLPTVQLWNPDDSSEKFDLIWINSVVQYMTPESFGEVLRQLAAVLKPEGRLVVSDLIPPGLPFYQDLWSLLRFSLRQGYVVSAFSRAFQLRKTYARFAKESPLYHPSREEVLQLGAQAGLTGEFLKRNLTHFRGRTTVVFQGTPNRR